MKFTVLGKDRLSAARLGEITSERGKIPTPVFMPVGTLGTVKGIHQQELRDHIGADVILGNTYHLLLRPGADIIEKAGGIHRFMGWDRFVLTDSGGYQVFSLAQRRKITEEGVVFSSHIDGASCFLGPETAIEVQKKIGADIVMAFDECTPYPCDYSYAKRSMELTHRWLDRCRAYYEKSLNGRPERQWLFGIVQGSVYGDLRRGSAEEVAHHNLDGNAIGGLSVGEPEDELYRMTELVCAILPAEKPRYLMGVGTPVNLLECIALGVDMFDCVIPTRNGRNGLLYTMKGTLNIKNEKWKEDYSPLDPSGTSFVDTHYSRAYVRHLMTTNERTGDQIATIHNLTFYMHLMSEARKKIREGAFYDWKNSIIKDLQERL